MLKVQRVNDGIKSVKETLKGSEDPTRESIAMQKVALHHGAFNTLY